MSLLNVVDDGSGELVGGCVASEILCADFPIFQHIVNGLIDLMTVVKQVDVAQHLGSAEKHGRWVGDVLAHSF